MTSNDLFAQSAQRYQEQQQNPTYQQITPSLSQQKDLVAEDNDMFAQSAKRYQEQQQPSEFKYTPEQEKAFRRFIQYAAGSGETDLFLNPLTAPAALTNELLNLFGEGEEHLPSKVINALGGLTGINPEVQNEDEQLHRTIGAFAGINPLDVIKLVKKVPEIGKQLVKLPKKVYQGFVKNVMRDLSPEELLNEAGSLFVFGKGSGLPQKNVGKNLGELAKDTAKLPGDITPKFLQDLTRGLTGEEIKQSAAAKKVYEGTLQAQTDQWKDAFKTALSKDEWKRVLGEGLDEVFPSREAVKAQKSIVGEHNPRTLFDTATELKQDITTPEVKHPNVGFKAQLSEPAQPTRSLLDRVSVVPAESSSPLKSAGLGPVGESISQRTYRNKAQGGTALKEVVQNAAKSEREAVSEGCCCS